MVDRRGARSSVLFPGVVCPAHEGSWSPPLDVYVSEDGAEWLVKVDAAGVSPRDVDVLVEGRELVVRGARRDALVHEGYRVHRMEICYSEFERRVSLPCGDRESGLEQCEMSWGIRDGMVLVFIRVPETGGG